MNKLCVAIIVTLLAGCATVPGGPGQAPPVKVTPTDMPKASEFPAKGWLPAYDDFIKAQVSDDLLKIPAIDFCPNWKAMGEDARRETWAVILKGIAKPESDWVRTTRYKEPGMTDSQGKQVWSEGLLQLSYQDAPNYGTPWCQKMSRTADAGLSDTDPNKSIFHPYINLGCGLEISERLLKKQGARGAVGALGLYWSTIRRGTCKARTYIRENSQCGKEPDGC